MTKITHTIPLLFTVLCVFSQDVVVVEDGEVTVNSQLRVGIDPGGTEMIRSGDGLRVKTQTPRPEIALNGDSPGPEWFLDVVNGRFWQYAYSDSEDIQLDFFNSGSERLISHFHGNVNVHGMLWADEAIVAGNGYSIVQPRDSVHGGSLTLKGAGGYSDFVIDAHMDQVRVIAINPTSQPSFHVLSADTAFRMKTDFHGDASVHGTFNAQTKHFVIDHPLSPNERDLVHASIEGPRLDLIYRGKAALSNGSVVVDLDKVSRMSAGTFAALTRDAQVLVQNDSGWAPVRGRVRGGLLTITCKNQKSSDEVTWVVIAERNDVSARASHTTDGNGRLITERDKAPVPAGVLAPIEGDQDGESFAHEAAGKRGFYRDPSAFGEKQAERQVKKKKKNERLRTKPAVGKGQ